MITKGVARTGTIIHSIFHYIQNMEVTDITRACLMDQKVAKVAMRSRGASPVAQ